MSGGAGQTGRGRQLGEGKRGAFERVQDDDGLVEHVDTAYTLSHSAIRYLRM
jgi:hypothetical protein